VTEPRGEGPIDLAAIASALRAHVVPIAVAVVLVTIVAYAVSASGSDRYRATARIVADTSTATTTGSDTAARQLATNVAVLTSPTVLNAAARRIPGETGSSLADKVSTTSASDADVIDVTATAGDANRAAAIANAVAGTFLTQRAASQRAAIARTRAALNAQIAALGTGREVTDEIAALRSRLSDLVVEEANAGNDLLLAEPAQPPSSAYTPRPLRAAALAFFVTLLLSGLVAIVYERTKRNASTGRDVARVAGMPLLASMPAEPPVRAFDRHLATLADRAPPPLQDVLSNVAARRRRAQASADDRVHAATDEALRSLVGAILLALPLGDSHVILVTSASGGPRSSTLAAGLARALAMAGQDTLVLSTDLASTAVGDALGVASSPGLAEALDRARAGMPVRLRAVPAPGIDALRVVPAGGAPGDRVGLMRPGAVDALFDALSNTRYRYIVVDAPALLTAPEGWLVAPNASLAIVACPLNPFPEQLAEVRRALERVEVPVLGAVSLPPSADEEPAGLQLTPLEITGALTPRPRRGEELERAAAANGDSARDGQADAVLDSLRAAEEPLTFDQVREALGGPPSSRVRAWLRQLVEEGAVVRQGGGRRGDPYLYGPREQ
jgi:capsular polysaccharide biosynthesis protein/Mrp family chromosome partitioning ATPase